MQELTNSTKLQQLQELIELVVETGPDMTVATEPTLEELYAERSRIEERILTKRRAQAEARFIELSNGQDFRSVLGEVLALIALTDAEKLKKGFVQRAVPEKAELYSLVMSRRITRDIRRSIPPRRELQEVFGSAWVDLAFPLGCKLSAVIPKIRNLLEVATALLLERQKRQELLDEVLDCHLQLQYISPPVENDKTNRGRRSKLTPYDVARVAYLKGEGYTNEVVLDLVNTERASRGIAPVGLTTIKGVRGGESLPASKNDLVANSGISDQKEAHATESCIAFWGGTGKCKSNPNPSTDSIWRFARTTTDDLILYTKDAFDDLVSKWPLDQYIPIPTAYERKCEAQKKRFEVWLSGWNL